LERDERNKDMKDDERLFNVVCECSDCANTTEISNLSRSDMVRTIKAWLHLHYNHIINMEAMPQGGRIKD
jgi:hypothetical protein